MFCAKPRSGLPIEERPVWPPEERLILVQTLTPVIQKLGWEPFDSNICLFKHEKLGTLLILYIDNLLIAALTINDIYKIWDAIRKFFNLKNMGLAKQFLGYEILWDHDN
jgi:hypothetical protein